tara:strand:+ start:951 stop:1385 length:435 start_codon:yes stop_codon:yes gene_type:complete
MSSNTYKTFYLEELFVGQKASIIKIIEEKDINVFAKVTGDLNPLHVDSKFAKNSIFKKKIAHGFLTASLISSVIGMKLPGPGSIYLSQSLKFLAPVFLGDQIETHVIVKNIIQEKNKIILDTYCSKNGDKVLVGEAKILVQSKK